MFTPASDIFVDRNIFVWVIMWKFFNQIIIWIFFCKDKKRDTGESGHWPGHHRAPIIFPERHKHCPEAPFASDLQYKPAVMKPNVS